MKTKPIDVYYNLHKKKLSLRSRSKNRRVIAHRDSILMTDCSFVVSEAGRQRVLRERRKNVHAVVRGEWVEEFDWGRFGQGKLFPADLSLDDMHLVKYNPYRGSTFVTFGDGEPVMKAKFVIITGKDIIAWCIN